MLDAERKNSVSYVLNMPSEQRQELDSWAEECGIPLSRLLREYASFGLFADKKLRGKADYIGHPLEAMYRYLRIGEVLDRIKSDPTVRSIKLRYNQRNEEGIFVEKEVEILF
jgi:hypothetical protein